MTAGLFAAQTFSLTTTIHFLHFQKLLFSYFDFTFLALAKFLAYE